MAEHKETISVLPSDLRVELNRFVGRTENAKHSIKCEERPISAVTELLHESEQVTSILGLFTQNHRTIWVEKTLKIIKI